MPITTVQVGLNYEWPLAQVLHNYYRVPLESHRKSATAITTARTSLSRTQTRSFGHPPSPPSSVVWKHRLAKGADSSLTKFQTTAHWPEGSTAGYISPSDYFTLLLKSCALLLLCRMPDHASHSSTSWTLFPPAKGAATALGATGCGKSQ